MKLLKNFFSFIKEDVSKKEEKTSEEENKKYSFFKKISLPSFEKTPVLLTFLTLIIILNLAAFAINLIFDLRINNGGNDFGIHNILFSNYPEAIYKKQQFWRILTFGLIENTSGFVVFFLSLFFIWATFSKAGYLQELLLGSKKTAFIWLGGLFLVFILQFSFTENPNISYYGTGYLSWIITGSLCYYLFLKSKENHIRSHLISKLIQMFFFLICYEIYKIYDLKLTFLGGGSADDIDYPLFFMIFAGISFASGFLLSAIADYKELDIKLIQVLSIFLIAVLIVTSYFLFTKVASFIKERPYFPERQFWKSISENWKKIFNF